MLSRPRLPLLRRTGGKVEIRSPMRIGGVVQLPALFRPLQMLHRLPLTVSGSRIIPAPPVFHTEGLKHPSRPGYGETDTRLSRRQLPIRRRTGGRVEIRSPMRIGGVAQLPALFRPLQMLHRLPLTVSGSRIIPAPPVFHTEGLKHPSRPGYGETDTRLSRRQLPIRRRTGGKVASLFPISRILNAPHPAGCRHPRTVRGRADTTLPSTDCRPVTMLYRADPPPFQKSRGTPFFIRLIPRVQAIAESMLDLFRPAGCRHGKMADCRSMIRGVGDSACVPMEDWNHSFIATVAPRFVRTEAFAPFVAAIS